MIHEGMERRHIMSHSLRDFDTRLTDALAEGWQTAPGTFTVQAIRCAANDRTPDRFVLPDGTAVERYWFIELYKPRDLKPPPPPSVDAAAIGA